MKPTRRQFLMVMGGAGALTGLGLWHGTRSMQTVTRTSRALGTDVSMTALHENERTARDAVDAAFAELDKVEDILSIYRPHSELSRLNRDGVLQNPHPYFLSVLRRSQEMSQASGGAFDVTVQPLWILYSAAEKSGALPDDAAIESARALVDWRNIRISDKVEIEKDMALTFNGIAQGFAADRVLAVLRERGIQHALVNTGELGSLGRKENGDAWQIGIQHPRRADAYIELAKLDGRCIATSGDYATAFTPDRAYNHIFNPETGRSPEHFSSVTVVARSGMDADALSTAIFVTGLRRGLELLRATPGADALFVLKDGRTIATPNFPRAA
jgi:thiamine biosynthesis lipoprotein